MYQVSKFLILDKDSIKTDNFNAEIVINDIYMKLSSTSW